MPKPPINVIFILMLGIIISIILVLLPSVSTKAEANGYALLIGINEYEGENNSLFGAINDIELLNTTLQKYAGFNEKNIILLRNTEASKENIYKKWQEIIAQSKQGDTLIFSFSGHGFHEIDINGDELDGFDEILLTSGFNLDKGIKQRILDDELSQWFQLALHQGRQVIYLADTCYSGDSYRDNRLGASRVMPFSIKGRNQILKALKKNSISLELQKNDRQEQPDFYFFSPVSSDQLNQEIKANDKSHGMLSWYFSEAIKKGDLNQNNQLEYYEIANYLKAHITSHSNFMMPEMIPEKKTDHVLFRLTSSSSHNKTSSKVAIIKLINKMNELSTGHELVFNLTNKTMKNIKKIAVDETFSFSANIINTPYIYPFYISKESSQYITTSLGSQFSNNGVYTRQFRADSMGHHILITIASKIENKKLEKLIGSAEKVLSSNKLIEKIPLLLNNTNYRIGVSEVYFTPRKYNE